MIPHNWQISQVQIHSVKYKTVSPQTTNAVKWCYSPVTALYSLNRWEGFEVANGTSQNNQFPQMCLVWLTLEYIYIFFNGLTSKS